MPNLINDVLEWLDSKARADAFTRRANRLRDQIESSVCENGHTDSNGNVTLALSNPVIFDGRIYCGVKRERRMQRTPNEERIRELAERTNNIERLFPLRPTLNEQALAALCLEGVISKEEIEAVYDIKESFAFKITSE